MTANHLWQVLRWILKSEMQIAWRHKNEILEPVVYALVMLVLFGLAFVGIEKWVINSLWVATLLSTLISIQRLFYSEWISGRLESFLLSPVSMPYLMLAKVFAHWFIHSIPLVLASPILAILLGISPMDSLPLALSLLLGTLAMHFLGAIIAALTVSLPQAAMLFSLLLLPLFLPILLFGIGAVTTMQQGLPSTGWWAALGALDCFILTASPFAVAYAIRVGVIS